MQQRPDGLQPDGSQEGFDDPYGDGHRGFSPFNFLFGFGVGAFVGVALALLAFALIDDNPAPRTSTTLQPDLPLAAGGTPQPTPDTRPTTKVALDVRLGPGNGFAVVGVLGRGESVEVVGRDNDSQWLAIRFPPGSAGRGWIPVTSVESPPDLTRLAIALPTPLPRTISTFPAGAFDGESVGTGAGTVATGTPDPRATPVLRPGPVDLVVFSVRLLPDRRVSVTVANRGPNDLVGFTVFVLVRNLAATNETISAPIPFLRVGATTTLETSAFTVSGEETIQATVDPFGSIQEVDRSNNTLQVVLAAPATPTATATQTPVLEGAPPGD